MEVFPSKLEVRFWLGMGLLLVAAAGATAADSGQQERLLGKLRTELTSGTFAARQTHEDTRIDTGLAPSACCVLKSPRAPDVIFLVQIGRQVSACVFDGREELRRIYTFPGSQGFRLENAGSGGTIEFVVSDQSDDGMLYRQRVSLSYQDNGYEMTRELSADR